MSSGKLAGLAAALLLSTVAANADVSISNKPTSNMSCVSGVCTATAQKAVLDVSDLANMLASGDVAVKTGTVTKDIDLDQPLTWSSTSRLTLDAQQSVTIKKQVTVAGTGALTVVTNDTGQPKSKNKTGEFIIVPEHGSVQFWDLGSSLIIDGNTYTLVGDIKTLAADIATNPSGFYALAKSYDASVDGPYTTSAIPGQFGGAFEGLGNTISNMAIKLKLAEYYGFFDDVEMQASVRDFGLKNATVESAGGAEIGLLVGESYGSIERCWASGNVTAYTFALGAGGLAAGNDGTISHSFANVAIFDKAGIGFPGGLVVGNGGKIEFSYAKGSLKSARAPNGAGGGLVGLNEGQIANSFSLADVYDRKQNCCAYGGLIGQNQNGATVSTSYAAGQIKQSRNGQSVLGGLIGSDGAEPGSIVRSYWNLDKGVSDPSQGAGNVKNDPGITGLTTLQLQAGLPKGFDPHIWAQSPAKNHGFPYLRDLPL